MVVNGKPHMPYEQGKLRFACLTKKQCLISSKKCMGIFAKERDVCMIQVTQPGFQGPTVSDPRQPIQIHDMLIFSYYFSLHVSTDKITTLICTCIFLKMTHFPCWLMKALWRQSQAWSNLHFWTDSANSTICMEQNQGWWKTLWVALLICYIPYFHY